MFIRKRSDLELTEQNFERLLDLVDVLDEVQLLRLQCKVSAAIGDPPEPVSTEGRQDRATDPPPGGLGGVYGGQVSGIVEYEELADLLEGDDE